MSGQLTTTMNDTMPILRYGTKMMTTGTIRSVAAVRTSAYSLEANIVTVSALPLRRLNSTNSPSQRQRMYARSRRTHVSVEINCKETHERHPSTAIASRRMADQAAASRSDPLLFCSTPLSGAQKEPDPLQLPRSLVRRLPLRADRLATTQRSPGLTHLSQALNTDQTLDLTGDISRDTARIRLHPQSHSRLASLAPPPSPITDQEVLCVAFDCRFQNKRTGCISPHATVSGETAPPLVHSWTRVIRTSLLKAQPRVSPRTLDDHHRKPYATSHPCSVKRIASRWFIP